MGLDRHADPRALSNAQAGATQGAPGKQSLVAAALEGAGTAAPLAPGKQTLVHAELEAFTVGSGLLQRKAPGAGPGERVPVPSGGGGAPLPPDVRARMEGALGGNFAAVRVHHDAYAQAIGALAFTRGTDIFFAPGQFDPASTSGLELIGHELTHVKQQAEGRVPVNAQIGGAPANDDSALEREADEYGAKAARGEAAAAHSGPHVPGAPATPASHAPAQAKTAPESEGAADPGPEPRVEEPEGPEAADAPDAAATAPIQRAPAGKPRKRDYIPFKITVSRPMSREEFEAAAKLQVFGSAAVAGVWQNIKDSYTPADSPVLVLFEASIVHRVRGAANAAKGIDTDAAGKVAGADDRAKDFRAQPASDAKAALLAEIDRRFYAASGATPDGKIKSSETGKSDLWRSIRDEVLFQHQYIANLPDKVKALIQTSIKGHDLTPADYDQLFRIAKKIEALPPGAAADYASKVTGTTTDRSTFEAGIESYRGDLAAREQADTERTGVQNKLLGLEEVYKLYRQYTSTAMVEATNPMSLPGAVIAKKLGAKVQTAGDLREQLEQQLPRYGFASIAEFASYIDRFEKAFEAGAVRITLDLLAKYAGKLYREGQRYQDPAVVKTLHGKLAGFRTQHEVFDKTTQVYSDEVSGASHDRDAELRRLPGNGGMPIKPPTQRQLQAQDNIKAAKANAEAQIKDLSKEYPILAEDDLPVDKRIDKVALAQAGETQLAGVLQAHIAHRNSVVVEARGQLEGKHELIYKMDKLMPAFYAEMDIQPGSIHDQIIKDKIHGDAIAKLVGGILLAIAAIALTVVSLGAATPAIVAAGASIGAAGLSTYMAYDEYKQYTADHAIGEAGFADDPSVVWLVLAIVGAGVDMAAATKAVRALAPAAKLLEAGGEVSDFTKAVEGLQTSKQIDEKIAAAADKAAAARKSYAAAKGELSTALGKAYSFPGPLTDPEVYRALVKMAAAKIKEGAHSLAGFINELKQARLAARLGELSPEELAKVKEVWGLVEKFATHGIDPAVIERLLAHGLDASAINALVDRLGAPLVAQLAESGITGQELQRAARLFDKAGLDMLVADGLKGSDIAALSSLEESTLRTLLLELDAKRVVELQRGLSKLRVDALVAEMQPAILDRLYKDLGAARLALLTDTLTPRGVNSVFSALGNPGLELVERIHVLEAGGRVQGLADWVAFSITRMNKRGADLANTLGELTEAERLAKSGASREAVVVGRDAHGGGRPSIDLAVKDSAGAIVREIDVTTIQAPVTRASQFNEGVTHALDKVGSSANGAVESTIQCRFATSEALPPNVRIIKPDGTWEIVDATGAARRRGDMLEELAATMSKDARFSPVTRVNITTDGGTLVGRVERQGSKFTVVR
jgi:hypothetical protein